MDQFILISSGLHILVHLAFYLLFFLAFYMGKGAFYVLGVILYSVLFSLPIVAYLSNSLLSSVVYMLFTKRV